MTKLVATLLTPPGRGAVATVALVGDGVFDVFRKYFRLPSGAVPELGDLPPDRHLFGYFMLDDRENVREGTVARLVSPTRLELHVHGGDLVYAAILKRFESDGAATVAWNDPCLYSGTMADKARAMLPFAKTEKTAAILLRQADGVLDRALEDIKTRRLLGENVEEKARKLDASKRLGAHLIEPFQIVLLGAVNAGKSSLINAILGFDRAIVDANAGTTRDLVAAETVIDGWPVRIVDTAGLRRASGELESKGIGLALSSLNCADLVLTVFDITDPRDDPEDRFDRLLFELDVERDEIHDRLVVVNKIDCPTDRWNAYWREHQEGIVYTSAKTGAGIDSLLAAIKTRLLPDGEDFDAVWI